MRVDRLDHPDLQDRSAGVEQIGDAPGDQTPFARVVEDSQLFTELLPGVGDEGEAKPFLLPKLSVQLLAVDTRAEDLGAGARKLLVELAEAPRFTRSAAGKRGRIEEDDGQPGVARWEPLDREPVTLLQHRVAHASHPSRRPGGAR